MFWKIKESSCQPRFFLQSDNTVKETKNQYTARILTSLTQSSTFECCSENHLQVGHTHEDVDGVLALCKSAIDSASVLETPRDVQRILQQKLAPVFEKRGIDLDVEYVNVVPKLILVFHVFLN